MAQSSGPISQGTLAERQFSDVLWRDMFGDEPGVIGDLDGTSYGITLVAGTDTVQIGSQSQVSTARVAGFVHRIPQGSPESMTVPAASGAPRTDILGLEYNPAFTGAPGPVKLSRIAGSSAAIPPYDSSPPGPEVLPLYAITRAPGQTISAATIVRMFPRIAPQLGIPVGAALPTSAPLDTIIRQGPSTYRRELAGGGAPAWVSLAPPEPTMANGGTSGVLAGTAPPAGAKLITKLVSVGVPLNANGDGTVNLPTPFPNGFIALSRPTAVAVGVPSNNLEFIPWRVTLSNFAVRCYFGTGIFGNGTVLLSAIAIGW